MKGLKHFAAAQDGQAAVQFAMVAAPFVALLVGALQLFVMFTAQAVLETAAESAGRQVLTGSVAKQGLSQSQFQTVVCGYIPAVINCNNVMVDLQVATSFATADTSTPTLSYDKNGNVNNNWNYNMGTTGSIVVLRLMYQLPVAVAPGFNLTNLSNGSRLLMATAVFKNESQ